MSDEGQLVERITRALSIRPILFSHALKAPSSNARSVRGKPRSVLRPLIAGEATKKHSKSSPSAKAGTSRRLRIGRAWNSSILRLAVGDDAAILAPDGKNQWVFTCDAFLENVHFLMSTHPPDSVGYKSLVRATSDVVAMGANPRLFLLTLALSAKALRPNWLNSFLRGMARAARELGMAIIGGDTTKSDRVFISITAIGEIAPEQGLTRSGARPGDLIYVSGKLGRAQLGLAMVLRGYARDPRFRAIVQPHLYPKTHPDLGMWLARRRIASSMMDISDGLSTDLARLCAASRTGAEIWADKIPVVPVPEKILRKLGKRNIDPLQLALHGGEDYQLLFTLPQRHLQNLRSAPGFAALSPIGQITACRKLLLIENDGRTRPLARKGWDPFRENT
ncbi:MAG: thiamine-phosphate kinase [Candidatus Acidiferrales bacterium]